MRLVTRYVISEFAKAFGATLAVMTLFMLLVGMFREALQQGLGPAQVLRMIPYLLPDSLRYTLPGTTLFAVSLVFGRMSSANEVLALKALGISPRAVLLPVWGLCLALSAATVGVNELALTWGRAGLTRVVRESAEEIAYRVLRTQRTYSTPHFSIIVRGVEGRRLIAPVFTFEATADSPAVTVRVAEAELRSDRRQGTLTVICRNGTIDVAGQVSAQIDDEFSRTISLAQASRAANTAASPAAMSSAGLSAAIADERAQLDRAFEQFAALSGQDLVLGEFDRLTDVEWQSRLAGLAWLRAGILRLEVEPHRRWANGFSCLCFALVGGPLAIRMRNADYLMSFIMGFLPILILYYPLLLYGIDAAKRGVLPATGVWLGNALLLPVAAWLTRHVWRY